MEDNSELHPESLRIQCKKAIEVIDKENDAYEELISKLRTNIVENDTMSGETADSIKAYASDLIFVVEYAIEANELDKVDHQTLLNEIDNVLADKVDVNEVLRGYEIHEEISYLENQISLYETRSQVEIQVLGLNAIIEDEYADQIEDLNKVLRDMHNKEERYDTIEAETKAIFSVTGEIRKIVAEAIEEITDSFINSKYIPSMSLSFKSELPITYIKNKYLGVYEYLIRYGFSDDQIVNLYNKNQTMFKNLSVTLKWSERDAILVVQKMLEMDNKIMYFPIPGQKILASKGIDDVPEFFEAEVEQYNSWSIEYSVERRYWDEICYNRLNYVLSEYDFNNNENELLKLNVDGYIEPVYAGAMIEGFADIGDIVKIYLNDGKFFYFMILDVKSNQHTKDQLSDGQVQCEYGHGYIGENGKIQLSICEFIVSGTDEDTGIIYRTSGSFLKGKYVTRAEIINHIDISEGE